MSEKKAEEILKVCGLTAHVESDSILVYIEDGRDTIYTYERIGFKSDAVEAWLYQSGYTDCDGKPTPKCPNVICDILKRED